MKTEIYQDAVGEWRWRVTAKNNRIVGASSEGFKNYDDCRHNLNLVTCRIFDVSRSQIVIAFSLMLTSGFLGFLLGLVLSLP